MTRFYFQLALSLNPTPPKVESAPVKQNQFVSPELTNPKPAVSMEMTPPRLPHHERYNIYRISYSYSYALRVAHTPQLNCLVFYFD